MLSVMFLITSSKTISVQNSELEDSHKSYEIEDRIFTNHQNNPVFAQHPLFSLQMSLEQSTKLRNRKVIDSPSENNAVAHSMMAETK